MQRFGEKLRLLRKRRGMTLMELAEALEYGSYTRISELETGKKNPTAEFVLSVARFFNVMTDELMKDELDLDTDDATIR
jgi:transcriptional regulator with XRE-family HTH domain